MVVGRVHMSNHSRWDNIHTYSYHASLDILVYFTIPSILHNALCIGLVFIDVPSYNTDNALLQTG